MSNQVPIQHFAWRHPRIVLTLLCLILWTPGFFVLPPGDRDESRFAQASKQMIETGDYVRIMNGDEPRNRKPIGIHWLQVPVAMAARAAGIATENPIWPYRIPSALGGLAAVLAIFELGLLLSTGHRAMAMLAGAMLAGSVILTTETHIAKTDAALLGAVTIAMVTLCRAWLAPASVGLGAAASFWLAIGVGVLLKGPIAPMVAGLTALTLALWHRRAAWLLALRPVWGVPLMLAVVLPWFVAIGTATHGQFFADAVGGDLGRKLAGGAETHGGFPGLHLLLVPLLAFPSSLLVLRGLPAAWRTLRQKQGDPSIRFLAAWLLPSWLVFEAVPTKLPHYTLPLYPALFLIGAAWFVATPRAETPRWMQRLSAAALWVAASLLGAGALALPFVLGETWWLGLPALPIAGATAWLAWRDRPASALAAACLLYAWLLQVELPGLRALWIAPRVEAALRRDVPGLPATGEGLVVVGYAEPSLRFLAGTRLRSLQPQQAGVAWASGAATAIVVNERDLAAFERAASQAGAAPRVIDRINGFNYSRGRAASLMLLGGLEHDQPDQDR